MFYHYSSLVGSCGRFHARMKICDNFPKYVVFLDEFDMSRKGYGGPDAKRKMGEIQEEINQSDKLMDELAALILSDSNN